MAVLFIENGILWNILTQTKEKVVNCGGSYNICSLKSLEAYGKISKKGGIEI